MYNFISEAERHEELYSSYNTHHQEVLTIFNKIKSSARTNIDILLRLKEKGISDSDIEWLKRTDHFLPTHSYNQ